MFIKEKLEVAKENISEWSRWGAYSEVRGYVWCHSFYQPLYFTYRAHVTTESAEIQLGGSFSEL